MILGGFQKTSIIDYPGKISCVLFMAGCNFHCPYCHNPGLVSRSAAMPGAVSPDTVLTFLGRRQKLLDGVVITGGEPTLEPELPGFVRQIRDLGFSIKLDTNGSRPDVLEEMTAEESIDYIAMDLKTAPHRYTPYICSHSPAEAIEESVRIILDRSLPHEFRTTCVTPIIDEAAVENIGRLVSGADRFVLQRVRHKETPVLDPEFFHDTGRPVEGATLKRYQHLLSGHVRTCSIR
jgi:pyruvate formate lyase activating enzyme